MGLIEHCYWKFNTCFRSEWEQFRKEPWLVDYKVVEKDNYFISKDANEKGVPSDCFLRYIVFNEKISVFIERNEIAPPENCFLIFNPYHFVGRDSYLPDKPLFMAISKEDGQIVQSWWFSTQLDEITEPLKDWMKATGNRSKHHLEHDEHQRLKTVFSHENGDKIRLKSLLSGKIQKSSLADLYASGFRPLDMYGLSPRCWAEHIELAKHSSRTTVLVRFSRYTGQIDEVLTGPKIGLSGAIKNREEFGDKKFKIIKHFINKESEIHYVDQYAAFHPID